MSTGHHQEQIVMAEKLVEVLRKAADGIAYAVFNLTGAKLADLPPGIVDSTSPEQTALIAERDLRELIATLSSPAPAQVGADEVLVAIKRTESYEDVHPELVAEDAFQQWVEYRVITAALAPTPQEQD